MAKNCRELQREAEQSEVKRCSALQARKALFFTQKCHPDWPFPCCCVRYPVAAAMGTLQCVPLQKGFVCVLKDAGAASLCLVLLLGQEHCGVHGLSLPDPCEVPQPHRGTRTPSGPEAHLSGLQKSRVPARTSMSDSRQALEACAAL